jgi:hypothetical protein
MVGDIVDKLSSLTRAQFNVLIRNLGLRAGDFLPDNAEPTSRAVQLLNYWQGQNRGIDHLETAINDLTTPLQTPAPNEVQDRGFESSSTARVQIVIDVNFDAYDARLERLLRYGLAAFLELDASAIRVVRVERGSLKLLVELPVHSRQRLLEAIERREPRLLEYLRDLPPIIRASSYDQSDESPSSSAAIESRRSLQRHLWRPQTGPHSRSVLSAHSPKTMMATIREPGMKLRCTSMHI